MTRAERTARKREAKRAWKHASDEVRLVFRLWLHAEPTPTIAAEIDAACAAEVAAFDAYRAI